MSMRKSCVWISFALCLASGTALAHTDYYYHYRYNGTYYGYDKNSTDGDTYDKVRQAYATAVNEYNQEYASWQADMAAYKARNKEIEEYDKEYADYLSNMAEWERMTGENGVGITLDQTSYHENEADGERSMIISQLAEAVEVPSFTDISAYRTYCQEYTLTNGTVGGSLTCQNKYKDSSGVHQISFTHTATNFEFYLASSEAVFYNEGYEFGRKEIGQVNVTRTLASQQISGGYAASAYPYTQRQGNEQDACEENCLILIGTYDYPIELNGPVYVDGDVVIRGFVRGQGSIYSGRNIHIIGDLTYYNPPSWPHRTTELEKAENQPDEVKTRNKTKDLLLLAARGNIIVGDYTSLEWTNATQMAYLNLSGKTLKAHSESEADIGYSSGYPKNRNYTETDGGKTIYGLTVTKGANKYGYVPVGGGSIRRYYYVQTIDYTLRTRDRRYYESSVGEVAIQNLKQTSVALNAKPTWQSSPTVWKRILAWLGYYEENPTVTDNTDSGDVTEIDAILYANHGIFGVAGGTELKKLHLNGAMICKDEGLLTSFAERFKNDSSARAWINWDMRINSALDSGVHIGAPEKTTQAGQIKIRRVSWSTVR